ncbi:UNKNOWN [Stylonychia lemnae]|uniref:Uncharacterized protein n=1 Tax=Stylonychia lemnae TaxID=5949 RepID=A0A078B668_STYLE|nr:UNKNOWN [Stylonychia lemnae]|eukprot:CDW90015.1 UNKNOWN [Stylonychia lemnae]
MVEPNEIQNIENFEQMRTRIQQHLITLEQLENEREEGLAMINQMEDGQFSYSSETTNERSESSIVQPEQQNTENVSREQSAQNHSENIQEQEGERTEEYLYFDQFGSLETTEQLIQVMSVEQNQQNIEEEDEDSMELNIQENAQIDSQLTNDNTQEDQSSSSNQGQANSVQNLEQENDAFYNALGIFNTQAIQESLRTMNRNNSTTENSNAQRAVQDQRQNFPTLSQMLQQQLHPQSLRLNNYNSLPRIPPQRTIADREQINITDENEALMILMEEDYERTLYYKNNVILNQPEFLSKNAHPNWKNEIEDIFSKLSQKQKDLIKDSGPLTLLVQTRLLRLVENGSIDLGQDDNQSEVESEDLLDRSRKQVLIPVKGINIYQYLSERIVNIIKSYQRGYYNKENVLPSIQEIKYTIKNRLIYEKESVLYKIILDYYFALYMMDNSHVSLSNCIRNFMGSAIRFYKQLEDKQFKVIQREQRQILNIIRMKYQACHMNGNMPLQERIKMYNSIFQYKDGSRNVKKCDYIQLYQQKQIKINNLYK